MKVYRVERALATVSPLHEGLSPCACCSYIAEWMDCEGKGLRYPPSLPPPFTRIHFLLFYIDRRGLRIVCQQLACNLYSPGAVPDVRDGPDLSAYGL